MKRFALAGVPLVMLSAFAWAGHDFEQGLARARANALAPRTDRAHPRAVVWQKGDVASAENVFAADGRCAVLRRSPGETEPTCFVLDFGRASVVGWAVVRVAAAKGDPVLRLAYANYPDENALRADGDFNERSRATYMGRDTELPILPANVNRHELYRLSRTGAFVAPMLMPQARYVRVELDTPGEVLLDSVEIVCRNVCDTSALDGYFESSDPDMNRLWQIGVWTAQLATIRTTSGWNAIEGRLLPRRLERGSDLHLTAADGTMPDEGSLAIKLECGLNPSLLAHAGLALFGRDERNALLLSLSETGELRWTRRVDGVDNVLRESRFSAKFADGRVHALGISWARREGAMQFAVLLDGAEIGTFAYYPPVQGHRLGFWCPKGWWPAYDDLVVTDGAGRTVFADDFEDEALPKWAFERPEPFVSDGAKRDRFVWSGDLYWAGRNFYYAFADCSLMLKTIGLLARNQNPEGYVLACPYAEQPPPKAGDYGPFESDEFAAWFIPVLHDYWRHTGDDEGARRFYPNVKKLLGYLGRFTREDGLYEQRFETSKHAFAPSLQIGDTRHRSYMDILLWMCWRGAAEMAAHFGEREDAADWRARAEKVRAAVNRAYWDESCGRFRGSLEGGTVRWDAVARKMVWRPPQAGEREEVAMEPNALALESGLVTPEQARRIAPQLTNQSWVRKFILLSAIGKGRAGFGEEAWQTISTNRWGVFAQPDWDGPWATAEGMDEWRYGSCDQSHPDVAPAGFISACYLGIVPLSAGYARFSFSPKPTKKLRFAEGRVPTRHGPIDARWERTAEGLVCELTVPAGTTAVFEPPGGAPRELPPGRHILKD